MYIKGTAVLSIILSIDCYLALQSMNKNPFLLIQNDPQNNDANSAKMNYILNAQWK